jgi:hypothetical protein
VKELIKIANNLDKKGLTKEADLLDAIIFKLSALTDIELSGRHEESRIPKNFSKSRWPWEAWNALSEVARNDVYHTLNLLSWIPVLGVAPQTTKFILECFEGRWKEASVTFIFIIIQPLLAQALAIPRFAHIAKLTSASKINPSLKKALSDTIFNMANEIVDKSVDIFNGSSFFKYLSPQLLAQKQNMRFNIDKNIDYHLGPKV